MAVRKWKYGNKPIKSNVAVSSLLSCTTDQTCRGFPVEPTITNTVIGWSGPTKKPIPSNKIHHVPEKMFFHIETMERQDLGRGKSQKRRLGLWTKSSKNWYKLYHGRNSKIFPSVLFSHRANDWTPGNDLRTDEQNKRNPDQSHKEMNLLRIEFNNPDHSRVTGDLALRSGDENYWPLITLFLNPSHTQVPIYLFIFIWLIAPWNWITTGFIFNMLRIFK